MGVIDCLTPSVEQGDDAGFVVVIQVYILLPTPASQQGSISINIEVNDVHELVPAGLIADGPRPGSSGSVINEKKFPQLGYFAEGGLKEIIGGDGKASASLISDAGGHKLETDFMSGDNLKAMRVIGWYDEKWRLIRAFQTFQTFHGQRVESIIVDWMFTDLDIIRSEISSGDAKRAMNYKMEETIPGQPLVIDSSLLWPLRLAAQGKPLGTSFYYNMLSTGLPPLANNDWTNIAVAEIKTYEDSFPLRASQHPIPTWRYETMLQDSQMIAEIGRDTEVLYRLRWNAAEYAMLLQILE